MLNSDSPIPLYHQLADLILARIRSGEYPEGSRIPSEHQLADQFGIGRPTARQATDILVRKNILERRRGSGTYVKVEHQQIDLFSLAGTISSFKQKGITLSTRILDKIILRKVGRKEGNPFSGDQAYQLSRLSTVDRIPVLWEDMYLSWDLFHGIDKMDLSGRSLSQVVDEHYYMRPVQGEQHFIIGYVSGKKARGLEISPKTPVLIVKRYLHFKPMPNAIYAELYCRTDRFVFSQTIGGNQYE